MKIKQLAAGILLAVPAFMTQALMLKSSDVTNGYSLQSAQVFNQ